MIKQKFKSSPKLVKKIRRRLNLKASIRRSVEQKYILYVQKTNSHLHLSLVNQGAVAVHANTIKHKRQNPGKRVHELMDLLSEEFVTKLKAKMPEVTLKQIVFDLFHRTHNGNIKLCISKISDRLKNTSK